VRGGEGSVVERVHLMQGVSRNRNYHEMRETETKEYIYIYIVNAVPLQAWSFLEGSRKLRSPDFMTTAQDGGKVVSLTHRPPLPPGNTPGTHFC